MPYALEMPNGENGLLYVEAAQTLVGPVALTDAGDHTLYTSASALWSNRVGYTPIITPDGVITGGFITSRSTVDTVNITTSSCYLAGVRTIVTSANVTCTRTADAGNPCIITSVVITNAGIYNVVQGLKGATLSQTRGAAGGPPLIPVSYIEVGQVKYTSKDSAVVSMNEIYQEPGVYRERFDYPSWEINALPTNQGILPGGSVSLLAAQYDIHTGNVTRSIYVSYHEPVINELAPVTDFSPPTDSHSLSSQIVYGGQVGAWQSTVTQGSFTAYLTSGVFDYILTLVNRVLTFYFKPDRNRVGGIICQGKLGVKATYPAGGLFVAQCTITSAESAVFGVLI